MKLAIINFIFILCLGSLAFAEKEIAEEKLDVGKMINDVVMENLIATETENTRRMMGTVHTQSPLYKSTELQVVQIFEKYKLKYELLSYKYISTDGVYSIVRVKQKTVKISGPKFINNEIDMFQVYRIENGKYKIWNQVILEMKYL